MQEVKGLHRDLSGFFNTMNHTKFFKIDNSLIKEYGKDISPTGIAVYCCLVMHADNSGKCFPSIEMISEEIGSNRVSVIKYIKKLEKAGLITVKREKSGIARNKSNIYQILFDKTRRPSKDFARPSKECVPNQVKNLYCNKTHITIPIEEHAFSSKKEFLNSNPEGDDGFGAACDELVANIQVVDKKESLQETYVKEISSTYPLTINRVNTMCKRESPQFVYECFLQSLKVDGNKVGAFINKVHRI